DGRPTLLTRLADVLEIEAPAAAAQHTPASRQPAIILGTAEKRVAFLVDALVGAQEVVIKSLPRPLNRVPYPAGATILGSGEVVMILNAADLLRAAGRTAARPAAATPQANNITKRPEIIMVADDSITTRMMEKNILEAAGYQVRVAADGMDAW